MFKVCLLQRASGYGQKRTPGKLAGDVREPMRSYGSVEAPGSGGVALPRGKLGISVVLSHPGSTPGGNVGVRACGCARWPRARGQAAPRHLVSHFENDVKAHPLIIPQPHRTHTKHTPRRSRLILIFESILILSPRGHSNFARVPGFFASEVDWQ